MSPLLLGADLAIKHGALVDINGRVLHLYRDQVGLISNVEELYQVARLCANATPSKSTVCIDWDRNQGSWGNNPTVGVLITLIVGFYGALCRVKGCDVHYVTPSIIRVCLGLQDQCSKEDVHWNVRNFCPVFADDPAGDLLDAWLLAYTYTCSKEMWS